MMQDIFEVGPRLIVQLVPLFTIADKGRLSRCAIALFFLLLPPGNFSADALDYYVSNTPKPNLLLYLPHYAEVCNEFVVLISAS